MPPVGAAEIHNNNKHDDRRSKCVANFPQNQLLTVQKCGELLLSIVIEQQFAADRVNEHERFTELEIKNNYSESSEHQVYGCGCAHPNYARASSAR